MKLFRILVLLLILKTQFVFGQENLLVNFTGAQIENYIHLNFTVSAGISCLGTEVQRSTDGIQFETIGVLLVGVTKQVVFEQGGQGLRAGIGKRCIRVHRETWRTQGQQ